MRKKQTTYFPSYNKIKQNILAKKYNSHQRHIQNLKQQLNYLQSSTNFKKQHQLLRQSIIQITSKNINLQNPRQRQQLKWQVVRHSEMNAESLNNFIEDDKDQDINFQVYLKFKKKDLERDLEMQGDNYYFTDKKKKQRQEQQQFFKELYIKNSLKQNNISNKIQEKNISKKLNKVKHKKFHSDKPLNQQKICNSSKLSAFKNQLIQGAIAKERKAYEKNKKYLTDNYTQILKKLQTTNIVKWRILNQQHKI